MVLARAVSAAFPPVLFNLDRAVAIALSWRFASAIRFANHSFLAASLLMRESTIIALIAVGNPA